ncbi:SDR family NAD(P)-dependent oxidoreductase [Vulgatibacter sp.]|uniref:SDR family NAD(P)-dependent oxidoreductase n=1 Tax=Vulgatibacter sp. TaxID=1971226 RepID=UPI0035678E64
MRELGGERVLITGAARGIGERLAWRFAREGAVPLVVDVRAVAAEEVAGALRSAGHEAHAFACDVSDPDAVAALRDEVHAQGGPVQILVNNAGVVIGGAYEAIPRSGDERMLAVNVAGCHWVAKTFLPDLVRSGRAHLVWMASAAGLVGVPDQVVYAASKWFVVGMAESLRAELIAGGHRHVGTTIVCPSFVSTGMFEGVAPPRLTRWLHPDEIAAKVVRAVQHDRLWVREPWLVKATPPLRALLPRPLFDRLTSLLGVTTAMRSWRGHGA